MDYPTTPDGRYFVVRRRLWRTSNPALNESLRAHFVRELMAGRAAVKRALKTGTGLADARARVDASKRALGERGPVWWDDGAPDFNRRLVQNTPYSDWYSALSTTAGVALGGS